VIIRRENKVPIDPQMSITTPVTQLLGINHPVLLAPMDLVADGRLVAAVDAAGGFGILGGGYGEEKWLVRELDFLDRSKARFGVGFISWSLAKQPALLDLALERGPAAVMLSFGSPVQFIDRIKRTAAIVICQVQSAALAKEAAAAGADILVAQGTEAGGHGATRGLFTLVPEIVDALGGRKPVVAAGGIADGRGLAAALMLGAAGVLMGTRFYATQEAAAAHGAKERIRKATGDDTLRSIVFDISRRNVWPAPFTGRCLHNAHADRWVGLEIELMRHLDEESARYAAARDAGDFDIAAVIAGEAVGLIHDIPSAHDVIKRVVHEALTLLTRWSS
jgi:nitronate monooxygenase